MKLDKYFLKTTDTQTALAKRIGGYQADVSSWARGASVCPIKWAVKVEKATGGKVTRKDLRKDWKEIWPELIVKKEK